MGLSSLRLVTVCVIRLKADIVDGSGPVNGADYKNMPGAAAVDQLKSFRNIDADHGTVHASQGYAVHRGSAQDMLFPCQHFVPGDGICGLAVLFCHDGSKVQLDCSAVIAPCVPENRGVQIKG